VLPVRPLFKVLAAIGAVASAATWLAACQDPCVTLAQRICDCELTSAERTSCRTDRIVNQQSSTPISDADRNFCQSILDKGTCTCTALDNNDLDACGFAPEKTK